MNERIEGLWWKARIGYNNQNCDPEVLEKFAELIVRECIEQGDTLVKHYINTHSEQEQVMLLASIADYSSAIKEHFGVEE